MTATGMGPANSAMSSAEPFCGKRVDPLVRQRRDLRREFFDAARDEGAIDEAPEPRVLGRLELQDRMALERVERLKMRLWLGPAQLRATHHVQNLPAEAAIAQKRGYVGMGSEAPEAVILPEECRRGFADRGVGAIGIAEEIGVARVEANAAARERRWPDSWARPLAQRIGGLNDIGSAAGPVAGRIEHEALGRERVRRKRAARGEIVRDRP